MPELPEVHTTATMLHRLLEGKRISDVWTDYDSSFHKGKNNIKDATFFSRFKKAITSSKIERVSRLGKNVLIHLSNNKTIIVHMKMTGHLLVGTYKKIETGWEAKDVGVLRESKNQFIHFVLSFSDGTHLVLSDLRKFAKITFAETKKLSETEDLSFLGPDPTEKTFSYKQFKAALLRRPRGQIKIVLLDQTVIAGIGNIYSDEILWASSVHPQSIASKIPEKNLKAMYKATKLTLKKGVSLGGDSTSDYRNPLGEAGKFHYHHKAYRNTGKKCEKKGCKGVIDRITFNGRGAHFCNTHQKLYK